MFLNYLERNSLLNLKVNLDSNNKLYTQSSPWLDSYFNHHNWQFQSKVEVEDVKLEIGNFETDLENTKRLYSAFKDLTIPQASDERLWTYLTHVEFWKYMRVRWSSDKPDADVLSRYFFSSNSDRALIRNGIARLWWFGYASYDETRRDKFELTKYLLSTQDVVENLLGRSFSRNPKVTKTILRIMEQREKANNPIKTRKIFRPISEHINWLGGVKILDALTEEELEKELMPIVERVGKRYFISQLKKVKKAN